MSGLLIDDQIAVLREQGFVVLRGFASPEQVAALRAVAERHLRDHVAPIEYEADLRYPGAPESRAAEGGLTVRRLLGAYARDPLFATAHQRALQRDRLIPILVDILHGRTCQDWLDACQKANVPAGRVKSVSEALQSPSVTERGVIQELEHPELGSIKLIRPAHGLACQEQRTVKPPPMLGEDTRAVLGDILGLSGDAIDSLQANGSIACGTAA